MRKLAVYLLLAIATSVLGATVAGCGSPKLSTSVSPIGGGSVTPSGGTYQKGVTVGVTAVPASGYRFDHWEGGASGTSPTIQVVIDSNRNLVAYFKKVWELSATASPTGSGSFSVSPRKRSYDAGEQVNLTATPSTYYRFSGWSGDASGNSERTTLTMDSNKQVTASFVKLFPRLTVQSVPPEGGTTDTKSGDFEAGGNMTITATAASGYRFNGWAGDVSGEANRANFVMMERDMKVTANFVAVHALTVSSNPSDGGTVDPKGGSYDHGTQVRLSATPGFPYCFKSWTGSDNDSANPTTVTMIADSSVTADFARLVEGKPQKALGPVSRDGLGRWGPVVSIPIQLDRCSWVQGEIIWQTPNTPNTPVRAYVQDPAGDMVKDFGSTRQANFQFLAQNAGRYTIVFQNNSIWYADYHLTYTVWGKPE